MSAAAAARQFAEALDDLEAMRGFMAGPRRVPKVDVTWDWGSSMTGYDQVRKAVSAIVSQRFDEIGREAVRRQEALVESMRAKLNAELANERIGG